MEARAPYHTPARPPGPRNLAPQVAAELRKLGFTVTERDYGTSATVQAYWQTPQGLRFYLDYQWSPRQAGVSLTLHRPGALVALDLIQGQHVSRLREVRHLLHNDTHFRAEWQAAQGQPVPATS